MDRVLERLERLEKIVQKQNQAFESQLKEFKVSTEESIDELYERADENEFQAAMNRIKWGAESRSN